MDSKRTMGDAGNRSTPQYKRWEVFVGPGEDADRSGRGTGRGVVRG
jgi:hypothetical protein